MWVDLFTAELETEKGRAAGLEAELETEKEKVAGLEQGLNKKKEALARAKELLEAAKSNALTNGRKVKEAESRAKDAETKVRVLEEKIKELEASVGDSSDRIRSPEKEIEKMNRGQVQLRSTEVISPGIDSVNVPELQDRLRRTQQALRDSKAKVKEAVLKGLKLYKDGFEEALKQVALVHPSVELSYLIINVDHFAEEDKIVFLDREIKTKIVKFSLLFP